MSKVTIFVLAFFAFSAVASAYPVSEDGESAWEPLYAGKELETSIDEAEDVPEIRQKRATCDLLSFEIAGIKVNDSACAANCLRMGRRGGNCRNGVCHCRR
nr:defensin-like protein [Lasioderma serricorne]